VLKSTCWMAHACPAVCVICHVTGVAIYLVSAAMPVSTSTRMRCTIRMYSALLCGDRIRLRCVQVEKVAVDVDSNVCALDWEKGVVHECISGLLQCGELGCVRFGGVGIGMLCWCRLRLGFWLGR